MVAYCPALAPTSNTQSIAKCLKKRCRCSHSKASATFPLGTICTSSALSSTRRARPIGWNSGLATSSKAFIRYTIGRASAQPSGHARAAPSLSTVNAVTTALVISRTFPVHDQITWGTVLRLETQLEALTRVVDRIECLLLIPEELQFSPGEMHAHEERLRRRWSTKLSV